MQESLFIIIAITLIIIGIIGTVLPAIPGLIASYCGLLLYKFGTDNDLSNTYLWIFGGLVLLSMVLNYLIPAKLNRKYGGTRWGSVGSFVGAIIGLFFIPVPFGFLIGMLGGVFIAELIHDKSDSKKAWGSTKGALIGFLYSASFNLIIGFAMLSIVVINLF